MRKIVSIFYVLLSGCQLMNMAPFGWDYPGFVHPETFTSIDQVILWTSSHIRWQETSIWQTPKETYDTKKGDCKAFTLLAMYLAHEAGINTDFVIVQVSRTETHAILRVVSTGALMDPQTFTGALIRKESGPVISEINYQDAEWISVNQPH